MISISPPPGLIAIRAFEVSIDEFLGSVASEVLTGRPGCKLMALKEPIVVLPKAEYSPTVKIVHIWEPSCRPGTTVLRANLEDGWSTLTYALAERRAWTYLKVRVGDPWDAWPICELEWFVNGRSKRFVRAMKDDPRWEFFVRGDALSFEETKAYRRRRIRDRFTAEMLWSYVGALGWPSDGLWSATRCSEFKVPPKAG